MRFTSIPATLACATVTFIVAQPTTSHAFLGIFDKKTPEAVPEGSERQKQADEASAIIGEARSAETRGKTSTAIRAYKKVVTHYPLTAQAAEAQFQIGELKFVDDNYLAAFDEFQAFVRNYPQSNLFNRAIERQFEIAEISKTHKKRSFIGIKMKMRNSDLIEMYETIIKNAPYSQYAPKAQFSLAEIYEHQDKPGQAVGTYQAVVENYPNTAEAKESQFRIGQVNNATSLKSQDAASLRAAQEAMQAYVIENPSDIKADDAEAILGGLDSREANRAFEIAQFYEQDLNPRAAAIYYQEVLSFPSSPHYAESKERLSKILSKDEINAPSTDRTPSAAPKTAQEKTKVVVSSPEPAVNTTAEAKETSEKGGLSRLVPGFLKRDKSEPEVEAPTPPTASPQIAEVEKVTEVVVAKIPSASKPFTPMVLKEDNVAAKEAAPEPTQEVANVESKESEKSALGKLGSLFSFGKKGKKEEEKAEKWEKIETPEEVVQISPPQSAEKVNAPVVVAKKVAAVSTSQTNGEAPLKTSQNYVGPPSPDLERLLEQPKPRMDVEKTAPKPIEISAAPKKPAIPDTSDIVIPPAPVLNQNLPIPPAPSE